MTHHWREYGLGASDHYVVSIPKVTGPTDPELKLVCPSCGCETLFDIEVRVIHPRLTTGRGVGQYVGCPACPFASPMLMVAL